MELRLGGALVAGVATLPLGLVFGPAPASAQAMAAMPADAELTRQAGELSDRVEQAEGEGKIAAARELLAFLARHHESIAGRKFTEASRTILIELADMPAEAGAMSILMAELDRIIAEFRSSGQGVAELRFGDVRGYFVPSDARLGHARALHRRAAELGLLEHDIARTIRVSIEFQTRKLRDEGRLEESLRAQDDTFYELASAGLDRSAPGRSQLQLYAETLTLARRDAEADALFEHLIQTAPAGSRQLQLTMNQAAFYRNIAGRFAEAEVPGLFAAVAAEALMGREAIATQKARYNYALSLLGQGKAEESLPLFEEALPLQLAEEETGLFKFSAQDDTIILLTTLARARAQVAGQELAGFEAARDASERLRARQRARLDRATQTASPSAAIAKAMARSNRRDPLASAYDVALFAGWAARDHGAEPYDNAFRAAQDLTLNDAGNAISDAAARNIAGSGPLGELVRERQDVAAAIVSGTESFRKASLGTDTAAAAELRVAIEALGSQLAALDARLEQEFPGYSDLVAPQSMAVAELQQLLGPDEALLMTLPSEGAQYVFAISASKTGWHKVEGGAAQIGQSVERLKCRIDEATCSVAELDAALAVEERSSASQVDIYYPRFDRAAAHDLYQRLIAPVADVLPPGGRVYTVASGPIAGLPLAVLVASPPDGDPESGEAADLQATDWLGQHFAFINLPSVSALRLARMQAGPAAGSVGQLPLVAYGAPVLLGATDAAARGGHDGRRKRGGVNARAVDLTVIAGDRTMAAVDRLRRLDPLPGTLTELRSLAASIGRGSGARVGADATETAVKADRDLPRADTVVFATHGLLPNELGLGSEPGLVLTPPAAATALDDGLLTASEAAALSLSARWVVLSACNTATPASQESGGESLSSLARSFLYAGARNLLASHWRVADDATAALTTEVLGNAGASPARALATAMDTIRNGVRPDGSVVEGWKPHWAHPASWAPFTLITNRDSE